jgi:molybdate transport system substrate-binding protein
MPDVKVVTTIALKGVLAEYEPEFRKTHGGGFSYVWGPTGTVLARARSGEAHDLYIGTPDVMPDLVKEGHIVAGSTVDLAKSVVGVAVKAGAPKPKIDTVEDVKAALRKAKSVTYTDPATQAASGVHVAKLLAEWGMTEEVNAKTKFGRGGPVAEFLVTGEAELALQQFCEHMLVKGVDIVGAFPKEINRVSTFTAGIGTRGQNAAGAKALVAWLSQPGLKPTLNRHGLFALEEV